MRALIASALALATLAPRVARADDPPPEPPVPPQQPVSPTVPAPATAADAATASDDLQAQIDDQHRENQSLKQRVDELDSELQSLLALRRFITVFVDVGAFAVGGDGSGIRSDLGHVYFPQWAGKVPAQWVFMGDTLSTAINSNGDPADASDSREFPNDTLKSHGHPSLIANSLGLSIAKAVNDHVAVSGLVELLPRPGSDRLDIELASIDYRPTFADSDIVLLVSAGKVNSVLGIEYRYQDAVKRTGITPSEICKYTCGRPIGVRAQLEKGALSISGSITNDDNFDKRFEPEQSLHLNALPTVAGHVQWRFPVGGGLELGASGAVGPQTNQPDDGIMQWHLGADLRLYDLDGYEVMAEYVQGHQDGKTSATAMTLDTGPCDLAPCLDYKGAYLLVDRRVNPHLTPYVRIDWRDAVHDSGVQFVYESHVLRATVGLHLEVTSRILGKIEYTFNHELDGIPQFPDDVLTSSIVVATD